jgi:hypothetical protein
LHHALKKQRAEQTAGLQFDKRPLGTSPSIHILRHVLTGLARHLTIANIGTGAMVPIDFLSTGRSTGTEIDVNMTFQLFKWKKALPCKPEPAPQTIIALTDGFSSTSCRKIDWGVWAMMPDGCMTGRQARGIAGYSLFARKLSTFEAIDTKTATVLVKTESRLFLPATIAENGRCIRARFGGQDLNFQSFVWA